MFVFLMVACAEGQNGTSLTVTSTYLDSEVACGVHMNNKITTTSGVLVKAEPDTYTVTIGDTVIAGDVPLCESNLVGALVRPPMTIVLSENEEARIEAPMNRYIDGVWTCRNDAGQSVTDMARYLGGQFLSMPGVMLDMTVKDNNVTYEDDTLTVTGTIEEEFASFDLVNSGNEEWRITCTRGGDSAS